MTSRKKADGSGAGAGRAGEGSGAGAAFETPLAADGTPYTFEKALERLEAIVDELEDGSLALEASIARFEEGVTLTRFLERELARAQKRVEELVETSEGPSTRPWAGDGDDLEDDLIDDEDRA
jgi:exodeoxyribonuclease VII small subunit